MSAVGDVAIKARLVGTMSSNDDWASSFLGGQLRLSDITTKLQKRLTGMEQTTIICKQASKQASKRILGQFHILCNAFFRVIRKDFRFTIDILWRREVCKMEKYEKARMEVIEFDAEDVITTSCSTGIPIGCGSDGGCDDWPVCTGTLWGD